MKIKSFTDLITWQKSHQFVLLIYKYTKMFPADEKFGLTNQIRRAVVSVSSNIAEGFSRKTKKDKNSFFIIAIGSITEVQNQLLIARDLGYIDMKLFSQLAEKTVEIHKLINSLIKNSRDKNT